MFHLADERGLVTRPGEMIAARQFHMPGAVDRVSDVSAGPYRLDCVIDAVEDERGHTDSGKQATDVHVTEDVLLGEYRAGARREPLKSTPPCEQSLVVRERGIELRQ